MLHQPPLPRHRRRHRREPPACARVRGDGPLSSVRCTTGCPCSTSGCRRAWPPSGTSRPSGSAIPHKEHWTTSSGRRRLRCVASDAPAGARPGLTGSCSGPVSRDIVATDEARGAMIPPCGTPGSPGPRPSRRSPGRPLVTSSGKPAHTKPAHGGGSLIPSPRIQGSHSCSGCSSQCRKSLSCRGRPLRSHSHQRYGLRTGQALHKAAVPVGITVIAARPAAAAHLVTGACSS